MRDKFSRGNSEDFRQRYRGTFGIMEYNGKSTVVNINDVTREGVHVTDTCNVDMSVTEDSDVTFKFFALQRGWYSLTSGLKYIYRIPARQFRRGICVDNCACMYFQQGRLRGPDRLSLRDVEEIVTGAKVVNNEFISRNFVAVNSVIYMLDKPVGNIIGNEIRVPSFIVQEVADAVRRAGMSYKVTFNV